MKDLEQQKEDQKLKENKKNKLIEQIHKYETEIE